MKNIQDIIFGLSNLSGLHQSSGNPELFIKRDLIGNDSDFFYFRFEDTLQSPEDYENLYNEVKNFKIQKGILKDEESFSKNFNMIIFYCLNNTESEISEPIRNNIYGIEKNPYHSNKFVIPYKNTQIESITCEEIYSVCTNFSELSRIFTGLEDEMKKDNTLWTKEKFILDVISNLHFIKVNYEMVSDSNNESIYKESVDSIEEGFRNKLNSSSNPYEVITSTFKGVGEITSDENRISEFEKDIYALSKDIFNDCDDIEEGFELYFTNNQI